MTDEAEIYRRLADTLSRETDPSLSGDWGWETGPLIHMWALFAFADGGPLTLQCASKACSSHVAASPYTTMNAAFPAFQAPPPRAARERDRHAKQRDRQDSCGCRSASLFDVDLGDGSHFVQSTTPAIARIIMIAKTTCSTANRIGIHSSTTVTAR